MALTSPDSLRSPDPTDPYNLVSDLAVSMGTVQTALERRANSYKGTSAQRIAFTTAPEGVHWQDTDGSKGLYARQSGAWSLISDVPWISAGLPQSGASATVKYRKVGNVVEVIGRCTKTSGAFNFWTIPAGYRPPDTIRTPCVVNNADIGSVQINSSGSFSVSNSASTIVDLNTRYEAA